MNLRIVSWVALCLMSLSQVGAAEKPNVLFIAVDDLRMNLGCYGDAQAVTPNIDQLAAQSVQFNQAYCQFASCNASRASVLTGMRPDRISVYRLSTNYRKTAPDAVTLPQHFKENGYHTESIGKILHNYGKSSENGRGWSVPARMGKLSHFTDYALPEHSKKKATVAECAEVADEAYIDGKIANDAVDTIQRLALKNEPFFLAVGFMKPHSPYNAPKKYWDLYDRDALKPLCSEERQQGVTAENWPKTGEISGYADVPKNGPIPADTQARMRHGYYAATSYLDANIGRVLQALEKAGAADNTIVVFWSDHGYHLGENDHWAKVTVRDLDAHVPLLVKIPQKQAGTSEAIVEYVDLFPTLSDLCGLPALSGLDGQSFSRVIEHPETGFRSAALIQVCRPWNGKAPIQQMGYSIRTKKHRYTQWINFQTKALLSEEIYEMTTDPYQRNNRMDDPALAEVIATHRLQMKKELK